MKILLILATLFKAADGTTTVVALHNNTAEHRIVREAFPPMSVFQKPAPVTAMFVAGTWGEIYFLNGLNKTHPRWAKTLAVGQIIGSAFVVRHNLGVIERARGMR